MSFKREGDVGEWLDILKKRRIAEVLGEDIPEDEVLLTKNGRLCCLVCRHRPVFDTLQVLHVHRSGKKHKGHAEWFYADKNEVKDLIKKRQHEEFVKTGTIQTVGPNEASSLPRKAWLGCAPYDPRVKKHKTKPYQRKPAVQLELPGEAEATRLSSLPGYHAVGTDPESVKLPQTIAEYRQLQSKSASPCAPLQPYISKYRHSANPGVKQCGADIPADNLVKAQSNQETTNNTVSKLSLPGRATCSYKELEGQGCSGGPGLKNVDKIKGQSKVKKKTLTAAVLPRNDAKQQEAEKYLMARGAGWKKDWTGKWVKDEDAEFDSDEEPPDLP